MRRTQRRSQPNDRFGLRDCESHVRRREGAGGFPDPARDRPRQAAGLSRQRQHVAEAAAGARRAGALLPPRQRQHPSGHASAERTGDAGLRGRAHEGAAADQRRAVARGRLHARHDRQHQPRRAGLGTHLPEAGRRDPRHVDGAPLEHRAVAARVRADRRGAAIVADHRRGRSRPRRVPGAAERPDQARLGDPREQRARHRQPGRRDGGGGTRGRRGDRGRRRPGRPPPAGGRPGNRLRLLRLFGTQDVRPDRHRHPVRPRGAAEPHASVPGRRRHDRFGDVREDRLQRAAVQVRGRHSQHRRHRRSRRGGRLHDRPSIVRRPRPTRTSCWPMPRPR